MAYVPGWRAAALNTLTGQTTSLTVHRSDLVQKGSVPTGDWTVHFHYHAPYIELSLASSLAGGVAWIAGVLYLFTTARRNRRAKVRA